jgi:surface antigen
MLIVCGALALMPQPALAFQYCTDYVNGQLSKNSFVKLKGNAIDFADTTKNPGIKVSGSPSAKTVVVFEGYRINQAGKTVPFSGTDKYGNLLGHVGWIPSAPGNTTFAFSDANFDGAGNVASHTATKYGKNWSNIKVDTGASYYPIRGYVTAPRAK